MSLNVFIDTVLKKYKNCEQILISPDKTTEELISAAKEKADIEEVYQKASQFKEIENSITEYEEIVKENQDKELIDLAISELPSLKEKLVQLSEDINRLILLEDKDDKKNVFLEIRAGTGGEEAALFAADLLYMYSRYAESKGWKLEVDEIEKTGIDGIKQARIFIAGSRVYANLRFESGTHRVQRVPKTENSGRIHTSAVTVAVLPEVDDVEVKINDKDLKIDICRASGAGGQHVNKTDSAVRLTHLPTGIVVEQQDDRSQIKNKEKAMKILKSRIYDMELAKQQQEISSLRKSQIGSGDRSEKIRTYNFPQNRLTDHRINLTLYKLDMVLKEGLLDEVVEAMRASFEEEKLRNAHQS